MRSKALVYPQMQVRRVARRCAPSLSNLMIEAIFLFFSFLLPPALLCALLITNTQSPSHSPFILPAYQGHFADKGIFFFFFFFVCVCVYVSLTCIVSELHRGYTHRFVAHRFQSTSSAALPKLARVPTIQLCCISYRIN